MTHESGAAPVIVDCELPESREKVWKALTVPELLAKWLMPNDMRPEVGARFRLAPEIDPAAERRPASRSARQWGFGSIECEVLEIEPHRRLRLSWRETERGEQDAPGSVLHSIVTFELSETMTGGTRLRLVHEGFEVLPTSAVASNVIQLHARRTRRAGRPSAAIINMAFQMRRAA